VLSRQINDLHRLSALRVSTGTDKRIPAPAGRILSWPEIHAIQGGWVHREYSGFLWISTSRGASRCGGIAARIPGARQDIPRRSRRCGRGRAH